MAIDVRTEPRTQEQPSGIIPKRRPTNTAEGDRGRAWWVRGGAALGIVAVLVATAALMLGAGPRETTEPKLLHTVGRRDLAVTVTEEGTLESSNNTEVRCKVKGSNTIVWIIDNGTEVQPGDVLVRLDTSTIEDNISTQKIAYQSALATFAQSESDVAVAKINITEYLEGTYRSELKTKEKDVAIAKANLVTAQNIVQHARRMFNKGYISSLAVESNEFALQEAQLEVEVKETELDALQRYTKPKQLQDLEGILKAKEAKLASDTAALELEKAKLDREELQLENCVIRAETAGMAIYGGSEKWEDRPDIREGATVREDQILLLIPDLNRMQIKVRIHEAKIERVKLKLPARIELQDKTLEGKVLSVASMAAPAGWWNGNMVKYETIITVDTPAELKPGMSANVDIILAQYNDVVAIPVAAVVEQRERFFCWVKTEQGTQRRELALGDSDDQFLVVKAGVKEGDQVVLNPLAYIEEAQAEALKPFSGVAASKDEEAAKPADDELKTMKPPENEQTDKEKTDAAVERKSPGAE